MTDFLQMRSKQGNSLLKLNDRLREILKGKTDIHVSTIILVGDQSHGKTSVIEGLTDLNLPRGRNIQTRAPTELRIKSVRRVEDESYSVSYKNGDNVVTRDFNLDEMEIELREAQNVLIGNDYDITDQPIIVNINKYDQEELTIIDLPGVTRALLKTQHNDIEDKILGIYRNYMKHDETIIVNVVSAMVDFTTSASLKLSNDFDRNSDRTILCVTKIDQYIEKGFQGKINDALKTLNINPNNLFLIRNRTQEEVEMKSSIEETRRRELELFARSEELRDFPNNMKGIRALSKKLVSIQEKHIVQIMFKNHDKLIKMRNNLLSEKKKLGRDYESEYECLTVLQQRLGDIFSTFKKHYDCLYDPETYFEEFAFQNDKNDSRKIEFLAFDSIQIDCELDDAIKPSNVVIKSSMPCDLTIEVRSGEDHCIERLAKKENSEEEFKVKNIAQPFFLKVVVTKPNSTGNVFNPVWNNEHMLSHSLSNKYSYNYFINPNFLDFIYNETRMIGQGFGLANPSTKRIAESTLKNHILPSHTKDARNYIMHVSNLIKRLYINEINDAFEDMPYLKMHLIEITDQYFEKLHKKAVKYYDEVFQWISSCAFNENMNDLYQKILSYIHQFIRDHPDIESHQKEKTQEEESNNECLVCHNLRINDKSVAVSPLADFNMHKHPYADKIAAAYNNNSNVVEIALVVWSQWKMITQMLFIMLKQLSRNFFINKPIVNLQKVLLDPKNYKELSLLVLMRADENIEARRKEVHEALIVIEEILDEIRLMQLRLSFGGFSAN